MTDTTRNIKTSVYLSEAEKRLALRAAGTLGLSYQKFAELAIRSFSHDQLRKASDGADDAGEPLVELISPSDSDAALGRAIRKWVASQESELGKKIAAAVMEEVAEIAKNL